MLRPVLLAIAICLSATVSAKSSVAWTGQWAGQLETGNKTISLMFSITVKNSGWYSKLYVPEQQINGLTFSQTIISNKDITIISEELGIEFIGHRKDSATINGTFKQNGEILKLKLTKVWGVWPKPKPQTPSPPFAYVSEKHKFSVASGRIAIGATLTFPDTLGKFPLIVLVSGSGPQDRDCSIGNHKPFWVIADYFTRNGYAVLRYDDRGVGESKGHPNALYNTTSLEVAKDIVSMVQELKSHAHINEHQVFIMGHSEGGMIAPLAAQMDSSIKAVISLAGPAISGLQTNLYQNELVLKKNHVKKKHIQSFLKIHEQLLMATCTLADTNVWKLAMDSLIKAWEMDGATKPAKRILYAGKKPQTSSVIHGYKTFQIPWWTYFIKHDPLPVLNSLSIPVLALNGSKDVQVKADVNIPLMQLQNKNSQALVIPGLNHLFQTCTACTIPEYFTLEESFSIGTLDLIYRWLQKLP